MSVGPFVCGMSLRSINSVSLTYAMSFKPPISSACSCSAHSCFAPSTFSLSLFLTLINKIMFLTSQQQLRPSGIFFYPHPCPTSYSLSISLSMILTSFLQPPRMKCPSPSPRPVLPPVPMTTSPQRFLRDLQSVPLQ